MKSVKLNLWHPLLIAISRYGHKISPTYNQVDFHSIMFTFFIISEIADAPRLSQFLKANSRTRPKFSLSISSLGCFRFFLNFQLLPNNAVFAPITGKHYLKALHEINSLRCNQTERNHRSVYWNNSFSWAGHVKHWHS